MTSLDEPSPDLNPTSHINIPQLITTSPSLPSIITDIPALAPLTTSSPIQFNSLAAPLPTRKSNKSKPDTGSTLPESTVEPDAQGGEDSETKEIPRVEETKRRLVNFERYPPSPSSNRPALPLPSSGSTVPPLTLTQTVQDLRILLKAFLVFIPSSLRSLRFLLPSPIIHLARLIIHRMAKVLHKRGALASSLFFDTLVFFWSALIHLFFREIRSRGAWKIPKHGEGAVIFVVGPHHNQVRVIQSFLGGNYDVDANLTPIETVSRSVAADFRSSTRSW